LKSMISWGFMTMNPHLHPELAQNQLGNPWTLCNGGVHMI